MEYIYIGKIVSTHGIKGEIKILSNFEYKEKVFKNGFSLYVGDNYKKEIINSYRKHKNFDMILLDGYNNINDILKYLKQKVYVLKEDLNLNNDEILESDIIGIDAYIKNNKIGIVKDIYSTGANYKIIEIEASDGKILIPYHKDFIDNIDLANNKIIFNKEGVFNNED